MAYSVHLVIIPPEGERLDGLGDALSDAPFTVTIEERADNLLGIWCQDVKASGVAAFSEALRLAQVGLSVALKSHYPVYANRGGLLWSDLATAEIISVP